MIKMMAVTVLSGLQAACALPTLEDGPIQLGKLLGSRQSGTYITNTNLVGDGDPHQVDYGNCSVSVTHEHSVEFSFSVGGAYQWISGGFSVAETFTDGEAHECGGDEGDRVCVWRTYKYTAYTVAETTCYQFNGLTYDCTTGSSFVINSPNDCQPGNFYCVTGDACRTDDEGYFADTTSA
ncbi:hypothetical protein HD806DRAFT_538930 [Xylariaceae sp. AK1471]|nr:hypothetical protein HD806DRAFT_538930 [Xylariaceae sp. AK1471]